jgi:hypothetical protein
LQNNMNVPNARELCNYTGKQKFDVIESCILYCNKKNYLIKIKPLGQHADEDFFLD